jgi:Family of unknown function (DUF5706)
MNRQPESSASVANDIAVGSELLQAANNAQAAATPASGDPPMAGFGSSVHLYLNQLLTLIYSKTTTLLAANMVLVSLLLSTRSSTLLQIAFFYVGAIFFFALSAVTSTIILFPRLHHHDSQGLIFWRSILLKGSPENYYASVRALNKAGVEEEYSKDNYHISRTIHYKDLLLRCAIGLFVTGMIFAVIGVVIPAALSGKH